jgi:hypothetical protein
MHTEAINAKSQMMGQIIKEGEDREIKRTLLYGHDPQTPTVLLFS